MPFFSRLKIQHVETMILKPHIVTTLLLETTIKSTPKLKSGATSSTFFWGQNYNLIETMTLKVFTIATNALNNPLNQKWFY